MNRFCIVVVLLSYAPGVLAQSSDSFTYFPLSAALLDEMVTVLPERQRLPIARPDWVSTTVDPTIKLSREASVAVTFIDEGAGNLNSFGYFLYDNNMKIVRSQSIFPNASEWNGGGTLLPGDTMQLGIFPAGTNLGFFLVGNGFSRGVTLPIANDSQTFYSVDALNPGGKDRHVAFIAAQTESDGKTQFILSFEDLPLGRGDQDYNDIVLLVRISPEEAAREVILNANLPESFYRGDPDNDGVPDRNEQFPTDSQRAFTTTLASAAQPYCVVFEDQYPQVGDGDYNDFVVKFHGTTVTDGRGRWKDLRLIYRAVARGAGYRHAFRHRIPFSGRVTGQLVRYNPDGSEATRETIDVTDGLDMDIFPDTTLAVSDPDSYLANTEPNRPNFPGMTAELSLTFDQAIDTNQRSAAPFDPYLYVYNTQQQIHLPGTAVPDVSPVPGQMLTYVNAEAYPFAMLVPANWAYPIERVFIERAYPNFIRWRQTGGAANLTWYNQPLGEWVRQ